jgi:hypothetical protein
VPFENEDPFPPLCRERARGQSAKSGAYDDDVVWFHM